MVEIFINPYTREIVPCSRCQSLLYKVRIEEKQNGTAIVIQGEKVVGHLKKFNRGTFVGSMGVIKKELTVSNDKTKNVFLKIRETKTREH